MYTNQTVSGSPPSCDTPSGGNHYVDHRQGDPGISCTNAKTGELCSSVTPNGSTTTYAYYTDGDLETITPPSPQGATTITYDSISRPVTVTDGAGRQVKVTYDNLDHITQLNYNPSGDPSCTSATTCIKYTYDNDGNLTQRVDHSGTTTYSYDALNRVTAEYLPGAATNTCVTPNDTGIHYGYDGASNLTSYCDGNGTVTYGYDNANNNTSVTADGATTKIGYTKANLVHTVTYPTTPAVTETLNYDGASELTNISATTGTQTLTNDLASYSNSTTDKAQQQSLIASPVAGELAKSWGAGGAGQIGNGSAYDSYSPASMSSFPSLSGQITQTSGGFQTGYALSSSGQVYAWGYGADGEIGNGSTSQQNSPVLTSSFPSLSGSIVQISGGQTNGYALSSSGQVYAWGYGGDGEIGNGSTSNQTTPVLVSSFPSLSGSITEISGGGQNGYALSSTGQVYAWGAGAYDGNGNGSSSNESTPVQTSSFPSISGTITQISAGGYATYALSSTGQVYAWGYGGYGEIGNGSTGSQASPVQITTFPNLTGSISQLAGTNADGYALSSTGQLYAWGYNNNGEYGNGTTTASATPVLTGVTGLGALTYASKTDSQYSLTGATTAYNYTAGAVETNQLTSATDSGADTNSWAYGYDGNGNRNSVSVNGAPITSYGHNSDDELSGGSAAYNGAGDLTTSYPGTSLTYNTQAQTTAIGASSYGYADEGQNQLVTAASATLENTPLGVTASTTSGTTTAFRRTPTGQLVSLRKSGNSYYYLYDIHGDVIGLINTNGQRVATYTYDPYGQQLSSTGAMATANPFGYVGGYTDTTTGYVHFGARWYDPALAAWTQQDPNPANITNPTQYNRYTYASDDPINNTDTNGECGFFSCITGVLSAVGSALSGTYSVFSGISAFGFLSKAGLSDLIDAGAAFGPAALAGLGAVALGVGAYEAFTS